MIYTMTLNPSVDYVIYAHALKMGAVNRIERDFKVPGGKGINVSRVLQRIKTPTIALGFLGGFTGSFIEAWLKSEGVAHQFTHIQSDTRINVKLKTDVETEINGAGPAITDVEVEALKQTLNQIVADDIVVFSGSNPVGLPNDFYHELIQTVKGKDVEFVIDTTGEDLLQALPYQPLLVKPNHHELADLYKTTFSSLTDIIVYGKKLVEAGAQHAIISMAEDGALLFTESEVYQANVLKRPVKNSVGAGDSMIAGFVGHFVNTKNPLEAFKWGVACGSATAFSEDLASTALIEELLPEVVITKL